MEANALGLTPQALHAIVTGAGGTAIQARRFMAHLHRHRPAHVRDVTAVSRRLLARLEPLLTISRPTLVRVVRSNDASDTRKLLLTTVDGHPIEAVVFPAHHDRSRVTLCVSSQSGCRMRCSFCASGSMGFRRDLDAAEIVGQVWQALDLLAPEERLNNVVFMGMGEPLENYDALAAALAVLHAEEGFRLAYDKMTVSTCGHLPGMRRLAADFPRVSLALSLHATRDRVRDRLVPLNRRYPIGQLIEFLSSYPRRSSKVFCIEYCLIAGVNDTEAEGEELGRLLAGLTHKIHLIPCNAVPGLDCRRPSPEVVDRFARAIARAGGSVLVRDSRGEEIGAACGQLGSTYVRDVSGGPPAAE